MPRKHPAKQTSLQVFLRLLFYALLVLFVLFYVAPLFVMLSTSFKPLSEIRESSLLALPRLVTFDAWRFAWSEACFGVNCTGIRPYFWNSMLVAIPSVALSTIIGALNGYALSQWQFKGVNVMFAMMLFGCFIPFQVVILPMAQLLGMLGLSNSTAWLVLVYTVYGLPFITLFFRNYYVGIPSELVKAATIDGAGFFTIFWRIMVPISLPIIV